MPGWCTHVNLSVWKWTRKELDCHTNKPSETFVICFNAYDVYVTENIGCYHCSIEMSPIDDQRLLAKLIYASDWFCFSF